MLVREATVEDLAKIETIQTYGFGDKKVVMHELIESYEWEICVGEQSSRMVGVGIMWRDKQRNLVWIKHVWSVSDVNLREVSGLLIDYLTDLGRKLETRCVIAEVSSQAALKMVYESLGFRGCGYNDRYYSNDGQEHLVYFAKDLI